MRIVIELKREANPQVVLNQLYRYTQLQDTVGVIMLALDGGVPKVMTLKDMLQKYIDFQDSVVRRRTQYDLKKAEERAYSGGPETRHRHCGRDYCHHSRLQGGQAEAKQAVMDRFALTSRRRPPSARSALASWPAWKF